MNAEPAIKRTEAEQVLIEQFSQLKEYLPKNAALETLRETAIAEFKMNGLPNRRVEAWKYTDLRAFMRHVSPLSGNMETNKSHEGADIPPRFDVAENIRIVFINGHFSSTASDPIDALPKGVQCRSLSAALEADSAVAAQLGTSLDLKADHMLRLNTAMMADGLVIDIGADTTIEPVIEILHIGAIKTPQSTYMRHLIRVGNNADVTIIERFVGPNDIDYQTNCVSEVFVGEGAKVRWLRVQEEGNEALHLGTVSARLEANAHYHMLSYIKGAKLSRFQPYLNFAGEGVNANLGGIALLRDSQHADVTLLADHAVPNCTSQEVFKAAVDGEARSIFQGKIIVRKDAQKTDGQMATNSLLLSEKAEAHAKPELEIFADDVVCAHGATCGELDEDLLFYLKARGLPPVEAEKLLIAAFLGQAFEAIDHDILADWIGERVHDWLENR